MQEGEETPKDFNTMFETELFKYDFEMVPEISALFKTMEVKHEPLTLIVPQFETPLLGKSVLMLRPCTWRFSPCSEGAPQSVSLALRP